MRHGRKVAACLWQLSTIVETEREDITIDGQPIVELDISHATPQWRLPKPAIAGRHLPTWTSISMRIWPRELVKRAFNITLNAQSETKAKWALLDTSNKNDGIYTTRCGCVAGRAGC